MKYINSWKDYNWYNDDSLCTYGEKHMIRKEMREWNRSHRGGGNLY